MVKSLPKCYVIRHGQTEWYSELSIFPARLRQHTGDLQEPER